jgi:hypothetical protein
MSTIFQILVVANVTITAVLIAAFWSFAGLVRSVSTYVSKTDQVNLDKCQSGVLLPIPYKNILASVRYELLKDFESNFAYPG